MLLLDSNFLTFFLKAHGKVLHNYPESLLKLNLFIKCYEASYIEETTSADLQACAGGEMYFVGLRSLASPSFLVLGAYGSSRIFEKTTSLTTAKYDSYGTYWYRTNEKCFGFSETPDIEIRSDNTARRLDIQLSWHLGGNTSRNDTECRMKKYESGDYRKVIYMRMPSHSMHKWNGNYS